MPVPYVSGYRAATRVGKKVITIYLDESEFKAWKHLAVEQGTPMSQIITKAMHESYEYDLDRIKSRSIEPD
ncbi:MAG: hypothetical protein EOO77_07385 [Oxalobacteraceae bacterium]|nr:MAG: hypothetical protein EOO77_07385 [Oxalobacteraceae bacterium]